MTGPARSYWSEQVYPCAHCPHKIAYDGRGHWIHLDRSYACRNQLHVLTGDYAAPKPPAWPVRQAG